MKYDINVLNPILLDFKYYSSKMSMFFRESNGILTTFEKIYFDLLKSVNDNGIKYLELIAQFILEKNYNELKRIEEFQDEYVEVKNPKESELYHYFILNTEDEYVLATTWDETETYYMRSNPLIDQLASLAGVNREVVINGTVRILTSIEMIILSRMQLFALNYDGSAEGLTKLYSNVLAEFNVYYVTTFPLVVSIVVEMGLYEAETMPNLIEIFKTLDYFVTSLGIRYSFVFTSSAKDIFTFRENPNAYYNAQLRVGEELTAGLFYIKVNDEYVLTQDEYVQPAITYYTKRYDGFTLVESPEEDEFDTYYEYDSNANKYYRANGIYDPTTKNYYITNDFHDYLDDRHSLLL